MGQAGIICDGGIGLWLGLDLGLSDWRPVWGSMRARWPWRKGHPHPRDFNGSHRSCVEMPQANHLKITKWVPRRRVSNRSPSRGPKSVVRCRSPQKTVRGPKSAGPYGILYNSILERHATRPATYPHPQSRRGVLGSVYKAQRHRYHHEFTVRWPRRVPPETRSGRGREDRAQDSLAEAPRESDLETHDRSEVPRVPWLGGGW